MLNTRLTQIAFQPERKVTQLCLSGDGSSLAWAEQGGQLTLVNVEGAKPVEQQTPWQASGSIVGLCNRGKRFFALDDVEGLSCLDLDGSVAWHAEILGGGYSLHQGPHDMAVIDALGRLQRIGYDGGITNLSSTFEHILKAVFVGEHLVLAHEDGTVQALSGSTVAWTRKARGDVGEAITALGFDGAGHLVLGREGYALVDGDEEALEMETWCLKGQGLLHRSDLKTRLTHIAASSDGLICGFEDGLVTSYSAGEHTEILRTNYAVQSMMVRNEEVVISSWFYLFGLTASGASWKMEHQGMPTLLVSSTDGSVCYLAGEDQNDWTDAEPIGSFSLNGSLIETEASELNAWFQKGADEEQLTAEEIYRVDDSVQNLLTEEERDLLNKPVEHGLDLLQEALDGVVEGSAEENSTVGTLNMDTELLLEALDDEMSNMAMMPDEDLFDALNEEVLAPIPPVPRAGDDREITCDQDGTAVVVLDGLHSEDTQNRIVMWSWVDSTGKEIATQPQVKVRLSAGVHRFELRICDSDGQWSSDSIQLSLKRA